MTVEHMVGEVLLQAADALDGKKAEKKKKIGLTLTRNEVGKEELIQGAATAVKRNPGLEIVLIGPEHKEIASNTGPGITHYRTGECEKDIHDAMERLFAEKKIAAAVTMHYNFPLGTATVGRMITPARGREVFLATTTGTSDVNRVKAMVKNAVAGIACAKALGITRPRVGILNIEGARACERALRELNKKGYVIDFAESIRHDGGAVLRGNDLLAGNCDVMVTDSLTGNVLMKVFSSFTTGGEYESTGYGYGPGLGGGFHNPVFILSRASGAPVVAGALQYAAQAVEGDLMQVYKREMDTALQAGLEGAVPGEDAATEGNKEVSPPPEKAVSQEITGVDILELERAVRRLWHAGIYAASGMGCTGPVVLVAKEDLEEAETILHQEGFL